MLIGAVLALRQHDLKLVLAYSTVAALGTMVLLVGLGSERPSPRLWPYSSRTGCTRPRSSW